MSFRQPKRATLKKKGWSWLVLLGLVTIVSSGIGWSHLGHAIAFSSPVTVADDADPATDPAGPTGAGATYLPLVAQATPDTPVPVNTAARLLLPIVAQQQPRYQRLGFGAVSNLRSLTQVSDLQAGWYLNWSVNSAPNRPNGIEYAQVVRVHQRLTCQSPDRDACPYVVPYAYDFKPDEATIRLAARNNPGALWFIGNEMDRRDWFGGSQDEMLPEVYAVAYHDLHAIIKSEDPTARVANGGVIQATPLRLQYLTTVWDTYLSLYGHVMPVDVWNVHNFILREVSGSWGADIPPGSDATVGEYADDPTTHINMAIFDQQIRAFRQWMKDRGQQDKPLLVNEYGVLLPNTVFGYPENDSAVVANFMTSTFDYFLNAKDCNIGYAADDCRLVQRWAWYSLDDESIYNPYQYLLDPATGLLTATGQAYRNFAQQNSAILARPIP